MTEVDGDLDTQQNADISRQLAALARRFREGGETTESSLAVIAEAGADSVPASQASSITLVDRAGVVQTPIFVGELARQADDLQRTLGEGPCIRSAMDLETVVIDDTTTDPRWPRFGPAVAELGVRSMVCCGLYVDNNGYGALNFHSRSPGAFDAESVSFAELFAAHAAVAFSAAKEAEQIRAALTNRDIIGQAKGMIMERYGLDSEAAFSLLARLSQDSNVKLYEVAQQVVEAGPDS
ncbi:GAF and ANTAR domain-containing protein [Williamsia sterculiae]|uniref:GAF and ANTAR domain-containing protein n=1 Tax=Williamsia sterculiae TaxID=1344003 RepID=UPI001F26B8A3|nr:GAF and ANTAR domain-containing protein [Williamsia sterculiae]